jgi:hypothetical protein
MAILLEDIADETSASNSRTAKRLREEVEGLEQQQRNPSMSQSFGPVAAEAAEQATDCVIAQVAQCEGICHVST